MSKLMNNALQQTILALARDNAHFFATFIHVPEVRVEATQGIKYLFFVRGLLSCVSHPILALGVRRRSRADK